MRTLLAAVDGGSLSAASRTLRTPLPTVSRKVSDLEAHLGTQLVVRTSRRLILTDAGLAYVESCRRILDELDDAERTAGGEYRAPRGELLVTASIMFGKTYVTPIVLDFLAATPEVSVRLLLYDHVVDLVENHIDVALRIGRLPDSGLVATRVGEIRWVIAASPSYLERRGSPQTPADLAQHDCLGFEGLQRARNWGFGLGDAEGTVSIRPRFSVNTADALIHAAVSGLGIARLTSYQAADSIRSGALVGLLRDHAPAPMPVHLVHTGPPLVPLKVRTFLDFAAPRLKAVLADVAALYQRPGQGPAADR